MLCLLVETPASATMGKRSRKVAATPAAVPAEADSPASCAPTARKCSRFSDPALEDEADGLAPVGTAIEQPQDDKASDLPAVTSSFQDEAPAPSFESPALQIASTNDSTGNETAAAAADNESAPAADIPEASRAEPCRPLTAQALVERLKTLLIVVTPIGLDEVEPPGESPLLRDPTNDDLALATEAVETFLERHGHAMARRRSSASPARRSPRAWCARRRRSRRRRSRRRPGRSGAVRLWARHHLPRRRRARNTSRSARDSRRRLGADRAGAADRRGDGDRVARRHAAAPQGVRRALVEGTQRQHKWTCVEDALERSVLTEFAALLRGEWGGDLPVF